MRLDSLIILRIEWNSYVSYLRGKQWKYWRLKIYNLRCVLCCVLCCVVLCCVLCVRPSSSSSVRPPSRPSVVVVLCPSVRPVRPSVVVVKLRIQGRMQIFEKENFKIWALQPRDYAHRIELDPEIFLAGRKLLYVLKKLVLRPKHVCFRILVPMPILTFWILYIMTIK